MNENGQELKFKDPRGAASKMQELFEYHEATEERDAFYAFKRNVINGSDPMYEELSEQMHQYQMDEDSIYSWTVEALNVIYTDGDHLSEEEIDDLLYSQAYEGVDVYTGRLTSWVDANLNNPGYVSEAMEQQHYTDFDSAVRAGQGIARREVFVGTLSAVMKFVSDDE